MVNNHHPCDQQASSMGLTSIICVLQYPLFELGSEAAPSGLFSILDVGCILKGRSTEMFYYIIIAHKKIQIMNWSIT